MNTLIIFFALFLSIIGVLNIKVPIVFCLKIKNENLDFYYKAFFKERYIKNKVFNFIKSGSADFDKNILLDVSEVIDIESFRTSAVIGTPFIHLTNVGVLIFSYLIPTIYRLPFGKKKDLSFMVRPDYSDWKIRLNVEGKIKVSMISIILVFLKIKRNMHRVKEENV